LLVVSLTDTEFPNFLEDETDYIGFLSEKRGRV